jgi:hypothetical protein
MMGSLISFMAQNGQAIIGCSVVALVALICGVMIGLSMRE